MTSEAVCSDVCGVRSGAGTAKAAGERRRRRRRAQVRPQVARGREGRAAGLGGRRGGGGGDGEAADPRGASRGAEGRSGASGGAWGPGRGRGHGARGGGPTGVPGLAGPGRVGWQGTAAPHLTRAAGTRATRTPVIAAIPRPSALGGDAPGWLQLRAAGGAGSRASGLGARPARAPRGATARRRRWRSPGPPRWPRRSSRGPAARGISSGGPRSGAMWGGHSG